MPDTFQPLARILQASYKFNLSRQKCFILLIEGLISARTVNLAVLSASMFGSAKIASHYKRLQRFMKEVVFDCEPTARLLASLSGIMCEPKCRFYAIPPTKTPTLHDYDVAVALT